MAVPSSIKTINQKIRRLGRKYGTESLEYQKYLSDVDRNFKVHYTKDGIMQINQPRSDKMNIDDISKVLYPDIKAALNAVYGFSIPLAFHMPITLFTRVHMILISVDMLARGEY